MRPNNFPDTHMDPSLFLDVMQHAHMLEINQHADVVHLLIYSNAQQPVMREIIV